MTTEGEGPLQVCAVLISGTLVADSTFTVTTTDGTGLYITSFIAAIIILFPAVSPDDYTALVSQQLTFTSGQSSSGDNTQCFDVDVKDDNVYEGQLPLAFEMFSVHLTSDSSSVAINSTLANATVTIFDNDSE